MRASELVRSAWSAAYSAQVATLQPRPRARSIVRVTILGPDNSRFALYRGLTITDLYMVSTTNLGLRNTASFDPPVELAAGESALGVWTGGSTAAGTISSMTLEWDIPDGQ